MSETKPTESPKYELIAGIVNGPESVQALKKHLDEGYRPDPVLMPTGRPNVVEGIGAIYHLIKLPSDHDEALKALLEYSCTQPTQQWEYLMGVNAIIQKQEMALKQIQIASEHPLPASESEDVILGTVFVEHGKDQEAYKKQGYFVAHKDHITAKGTILSQMGKRPKPEEKRCPKCSGLLEKKQFDEGDPDSVDLYCPACKSRWCDYPQGAPENPSTEPSKPQSP